MDCGVVSIWHIPAAEHKALHECSWLDIRVNIISKAKMIAGVPAKVILAQRQAMQMVSVAQPLTELARDGAESMFARVNCVFLITKQYSVRIVGRERRSSHWHATYPGTRK